MVRTSRSETGPHPRISDARPRRLRQSAGLRELVAEHRWDVGRLVYPLFVLPRETSEEPKDLPGLARRGVEGTVREAEAAFAGGIRSVLLFGLPAHKDPRGSEAWKAGAAVPRAIRALKARLPELVVAADVCLCEYTDHGHCGLVRNGRVDNDATLPLLARVAVTYAEAGADLVAPSAMMDHQVRAIRAGLDRAGHGETGILAYSAKYASSFYGPFRQAAESAPSFGDRRGYQMDPRNVREALRELELDAQEGADVLMVKPALPYLDVLARARSRFSLPLAAYQVSGEYAVLKAAVGRGWLDEAAAVDETLGSIRRAGADIIISYYAGEIARGRFRSSG